MPHKLLLKDTANLPYCLISLFRVKGVALVYSAQKGNGIKPKESE